MASADFRFDIRTPREARSQWHQIGSPQVRRTSFLPVHRIYVSDSCMSIGHWVFWPPHPSEPPHIRFLFVEHAFCYRLPPDLMLPLRPCRVANSSPHRASSGFAPYRSAPCWAHQKNTFFSSLFLKKAQSKSDCLYLTTNQEMSVGPWLRPTCLLCLSTAVDTMTKTSCYC